MDNLQKNGNQRAVQQERSALFKYLTRKDQQSARLVSSCEEKKQQKNRYLKIL